MMMNQFFMDKKLARELLQATPWWRFLYRRELRQALKNIELRESTLRSMIREIEANPGPYLNAKLKPGACLSTEKII